MLNTEFYSDERRNEIMESFNTVLNTIGNNRTGNYLSDIPDNLISNVMCELIKGDVMCRSLYRIIEDYDEDNTQVPIIHNDSMTTWCNVGAENYCLTIEDILKLHKGDTLDLILIDSNVGDYTHDFKIGISYNPRKEGLSYGTYTHIDGITGTMVFTDVSDEPLPFTWQLNVASISGYYWGGVGLNTNCTCGSDDPLAKYEYTDFDPKTKVGWRGPAITVKDSYNLPEKVTHYGNWWNDYKPIRNRDLTHFYRGDTHHAKA